MASRHGSFVTLKSSMGVDWRMRILEILRAIAVTGRCLGCAGWPWSMSVSMGPHYKVLGNGRSFSM